MPERRVLRQPSGTADAGKANLISAGTFRELSQSIGKRSQALANEQAAIAGQQAALDDPSRPVGSGITQADRSFSNAFLDTARVVTVSSGQEQLLNIQRDTTENGAIGSDSLSTYDNLSEGAIEGILEETPIQIRGDVQLALAKINVGNRQNVAQKVQVYNNGVALAFLEQSISSYSAQAGTYYIEGNVEKGDNLLQESVLAINTSVEQGLITPIQGAQQKKELDFGRKSAILNGKLRAAESVGRTEEFLNEFFTNPPKGITDIEHRQLSQSLVQEARFIGSLKGQQQQINYENLSTGISLGAINSQQEIEQAKGEITGAQENKLSNQLLQKKAKEQSEKLSNEQIWGYINNNSIELANVSDGQVSQAYLAMLDIKRDEKQQNALDMGAIQEGDVVELSLQEKASIASHIPKKVSPLQSELKFIAASGTPEQKIEAAQSYRFLVDNNKDVVLDGLDSNARDYFEAITQFTRTGGVGDPLQAIEFVDSLLNVDQNVKNERKENWKVETKDEGLESLSDWSTELAKQLGAKHTGFGLRSLFGAADPSKIPEGAADQFRKLTQDSFSNFGDMEHAKASAASAMKTSYGPDLVTNSGKLLYLPPQITIPGYAENPTFAFNSFASSIAGYAVQFNSEEGFEDIDGRTIGIINPEPDDSFLGISFTPAFNSEAKKELDRLMEESAGASFDVLGVGGDSGRPDLSKFIVETASSAISGLSSFALDVFKDVSPLFQGHRNVQEEIDLGPEGDILTERLQKKVVLEVDGVPREIIYFSDYDTANPAINAPISYGLGYLNDGGQIEQLKNQNGKFARWVPDSLDEAERAFQNTDAFRQVREQKEKDIKRTIATVQSMMGLVPFVGQGFLEDTSITSAL